MASTYPLEVAAAVRTIGSPKGEPGPLKKPEGRVSPSLDRIKSFPKFFAAGCLGLDSARASDRASGSASYPCCSMEDVAMNLDYDPFWRSSVGFDRLLELM